MLGMGEHVDGLHGHDGVFGVEEGEVAGLRGGVAAHVDDGFGLGAEDGVDHVGVHAGARRVDDHHVGLAVFGYEVVGENVLHVAGKEEGVGYAVYLGVEACVVDGFGDVLDAHDLRGLAADEVGDCAGAGIEVVDEFVATETGEVADDLVELVGLCRIGLIERLWPDAEAQAFHLLLYVRASGTEHYLLVGDGVVDLGVYHGHQRCDLWELGGDGVGEGFEVVGTVVADNDNQHNLARGGCAHHHGADESLLGAEVVEWQAVGLAVVLHEVAQTVGNVVLEVAGFDVEHLVEGAGNVETCGVAVGEFLPRGELLEGEPAAVGEGELELVAVVPNVLAAQALGHFGNGHFCNAGECVDYLLALALQLVLVGEVLPPATAAHGEMLAAGLDTHAAGPAEARYAALGVAFLFLLNLNVDTVAWRAEGHEDHHIVDARNGIAFGGNGAYLDVLQKRQGFSFS